MPPPPPPMSAGMPVPGGLMGPAQMAQPTIGPQAMPPGMISMLDPATNNQPLQFNTNKGKPPMPVMGEMQEVEQRVMLGGGRPDRVMRDRDRNDRDYDRDRERSRSNDSSKLCNLCLISTDRPADPDFSWARGVLTCLWIHQCIMCFSATGWPYISIC